MPKARNPRHGSMQFWPRKRASRPYGRVRSRVVPKDTKLAEFAGYKVGMTHIIAHDNRKHVKKNTEMQVPVTIIECPPLKVAGASFYDKTPYGLKKITSYITGEKELSRKITLAKNKKELTIPESFSELKIIVETQPKKAGIGKKKPELFEVALGGKKEEQVEFLKNNIGKEIPITDVFKEGDQVDICSVTIGKGFQGPVKRFGVAIRSHKSEKTIRGPGSLGGWKAQGHFMYRIAYAGQTGYHQRTEFNKWLLKIGDTPKEINQKGGISHYGEVKTTYILLKGSIGGPKKRLIRLKTPERPNRHIPNQPPEIEYVSRTSKQG